MVESTKNLYEILNIPCDSTYETIKASYKKLVRIYHPDINKSQVAEINFKLLNNAYEILSDPIKRENYDNLLKMTGEYKASKAEIQPLKKEFKQEFKQKFGEFIKKEPEFISPNPEIDIIKEIKITPDEKNQGTTRIVNILNKQICPKCQGKRFINGSTCAFCKGEGNKKEYKKIEAKIPACVSDGDYIYVDKVNTSALYDKNLFLKIKIEPYKKIFFEEDKVLIYLDVFYEDLILGCNKEVAIPEIGIVDIVIPENSKPDDRIKIEVGINYFAVLKLIFSETVPHNEKILYDRIRKTRLRDE